MKYHFASRHRHLNIWSPVDGTVWCGPGDAALREGDYHRQWALRVPSLISLPVLPSPTAHPISLCFVLVVEDVITAAIPPCHDGLLYS